MDLNALNLWDLFYESKNSKFLENSFFRSLAVGFANLRHLELSARSTNLQESGRANRAMKIKKMGHCLWRARGMK